MVPSLRNDGCFLTLMNTYKSPAGPPFLPTLPSFLTRSLLSVSTPATHLNLSTCGPVYSEGKIHATRMRGRDQIASQAMKSLQNNKPTLLDIYQAHQAKWVIHLVHIQTFTVGFCKQSIVTDCLLLTDQG